MTPRLRAISLVGNMKATCVITNDYVYESSAIECALITVDEIIRESKLHDKTTYQHGRTSYWQEVENELIKLK